MNAKLKKAGTRILAALILLILLLLLEPMLEGHPVLRLVLYLVPYLIVGYDVLKGAWHGMKNRRPFDEKFLMALATVGAFMLGEFTEGVAVMLFYQIGEFFLSYAADKIREPRFEAFISRFAKVYTPAVCFAALFLAVAMPVLRFILGNDPHWGDWIYRALTFLVLSCPGALAVSSPLSSYGGIGIKMICLLLSALGLINMWLAALLDVGVMILAVFSAMRAQDVKNP